MAAVAVAAHSTAPARTLPSPPPFLPPTFLPSAALEPSLLPSVYNQPLFLPFPLALALGSRSRVRRPTLDTSGLSWGPRETGAGILNSKYLSRRRGAGRHPDKRVERVQACMGRLGWEIAKKPAVRDIFLERAESGECLERHFYSQISHVGCFPISPPSPRPPSFARDNLILGNIYYSFHH